MGVDQDKDFVGKLIGQVGKTAPLEQKKICLRNIYIEGTARMQFSVWAKRPYLKAPNGVLLIRK